jgi:hypothetical protein
MCYQKHLSSKKQQGHAPEAPLDAPDFDEDFDRADKNHARVTKMFEGVVGCENIVSKLEGYQQLVKKLRQSNMDPCDQIPFNFVSAVLQVNTLNL